MMQRTVFDMNPGDSYRINGGVFTVVDDARCETVYDDGTVAPADTWFVDDELVERAASLGYPPTEDGVLQMHREHELLHSIVAEAMGKPASDALHTWNKYGMTQPGQIPLEERICFLVQRTLNQGRLILEERRC